jgi:hypothetical protein
MKNNFSVIKEQEQTFYVGKGTWQLTSAGGLNYVGSGPSDYDVIMSPDGYSLSLPWGSVNGSMSSLSESTAKSMFGFVAQYSQVEWGMSINYDGTAKLYTDHKADQVNLKLDDNTRQVVHSHTPSYGGELSQEDKDNARSYNYATHSLYYNGEYRDYGYGGFY